MLLSIGIGEIFRKNTEKRRKKNEKNIAYSRAIIYIPKTGDFRLQTVMLPIGRFGKLLRRRTFVIRGRPNKVKNGLKTHILY